MSATVRALIGYPWRHNSSASFAVLLDDQRNGDMGSPRVAGSTSRSNSFTSRGSCSAFDFLPPPAFRTRSGGTSLPSRSRTALCRCGAAQPSGPRQRCDSSMAQKPRIRRCHQPPLPFIQIRIQKSMLSTQSGIVGHDAIIYSSGQNVQLILARLLRLRPAHTSFPCQGADWSVLHLHRGESLHSAEGFKELGPSLGSTLLLAQATGGFTRD